MGLLRNKLNKHLASYSFSKQELEKEQQSLVKAKETVENTLTAQKIVQEVSSKIQDQASQQIASIVSRCLKAVFGESAYTFKIRYEQKRGKTEANLVFVKDGQEIDPIDASGGGVVDVASFALRLSALILTRPHKRRLLIADEPFKHLSKNHIPAVREMLQSLSEELGLQILMVTHNPRLEIGKVINLE